MDTSTVFAGLSVIGSAVAIAVAIGANRKANNIGTAELRNSNRLKELEEQRFEWEAKDRELQKQQERIEQLLSLQQGVEDLAANLSVRWAQDAIFIINCGPHTAWDVSWRILDSDGDSVGLGSSEGFTNEIAPNSNWRYLHPRTGETADDSNIRLSWTDGLGKRVAFSALLSMDNTVTINVDESTSSDALEISLGVETSLTQRPTETA